MTRLLVVLLVALFVPGPIQAQLSPSKYTTRRPRNGPTPPNFRYTIPAKDPKGKLGAISAAPAKAVAPTTTMSQTDLREFAKRIHIGTGEEFVMKFMYRVKGAQFYPVNMNLYEYHFDFALANLDYKKGPIEFNKNYIGPGASREFVNASLILKKDPKSADFNKVLLELWTGDSLDAKFIRQIMKDISNVMPAPMTEKTFIYHPLSQEQEAIITADIKAGNIPRERVVFTEQLFEGKEYLALNEGEAVGILKFVKKMPVLPENLTKEEKKLFIEKFEAENAVDHFNIAVYESAPNDIGLVAAVVTEEPQTLLSHINIKSINRKTANMFYRGVFQKWKQFEGKFIRIKVGAEVPVPEILAQPHEKSKIASLVSKFWEPRRPKLTDKPTPVIDPNFNDKLMNLVGYYQKLLAKTFGQKGLPTRAQHRDLTRRVGGKAANLGLLNLLVEKQNKQLQNLKIPGAIVPEVVAIPFNFYDQFLAHPQPNLDPNRPGLTAGEFIDETLRNAGLLTSGELHRISDVAPVLRTLREALSKAELPPKLLELLKHEIMDDMDSPIYIGKHPRLRFRSSTSAEDMDGFTGAGLYDSDGVNLYEKFEMNGKKDGSYDKTRRLEWKDAGNIKGIESKIKEVIPALFASIWNDRAFTEREWFKIDGEQHLAIKAGLAIHGAFPFRSFNIAKQLGSPTAAGEMANGVGITTNVFDPEDSNRLFINGQHFDLAVTNPPADKDFEDVGEPPPQSGKPYSSEELLMTTFLADDFENSKPGSFAKWPVEKFRSSSVKNGEPVLKPISLSLADEAHILGLMLKRISDDMAIVYGRDPETFYIDTEWKLFGRDRKIFIKQARPFEPPKF
jgi:hypothetical protein